MKKCIKIMTFILCIMSFVVRYKQVEAYEITSGNKGGINQSYVEELSKVATLWPSLDGSTNGQLIAIRVRIFRKNDEDNWEEQKSKYFVVTNNSNRCYDSVTAKYYETNLFGYTSLKSTSGLKGKGKNKKIVLGCIVDSTLSNIFENGKSLDDFFKANNYKALVKTLENMKYTSITNGDRIIVEPATLVRCAGDVYFGTSTALMKANVSYQGKDNNLCSANDSYNGYTFQNVFREMSHALKTKDKNCKASDINSNYSGCGFFSYYVSDIYNIKVIYHSNNATVKKLEGKTISSDSKIPVQTFKMGKNNSNGLYDVQNINYLYLARTNYKATGYWLKNSSDSSIKYNQLDKLTWEGTKAYLGDTFLADVSNGSVTVDVYAEWNNTIPAPTIKIKKVNNGGKEIVGKYATFNLYKGLNCKDTNPQEVLVQGNETVTIDKNQAYSIKEIIPPEGYEIYDSCINIDPLEEGQTKTISVVNSTTCGVALNALGDNPTMEQLIELYNREKLENGNNYTNLLKTSNPSCSTADCTLTSNLSCLNASVSYTNFNENDLSCVEEYITRGDLGETDALLANRVIGFCATKFSLTNNISSINNNITYSTNNSSDFHFYANAGQFLLKQNSWDDEILMYDVSTNSYQSIGSKYLAQGKTTKVCYLSPENEITIVHKNSDLNLDGIINEVDYELLMQHLNGWDTILPYIPGDVNNDGLVNMRDQGLISRYIQDFDVAISTINADVNADGVINSFDLGLVQQYVAGWDVVLSSTIISGDVNGDGKVNVRDQGRLQQYLADNTFYFDVNDDSDINRRYKLYFGDNDKNGISDSLKYDLTYNVRNNGITENDLMKYEFNYIQNYKLLPVYFEKISGKYSSNVTSTSTQTPIYGVLSNFNSSYGTIKYGISYHEKGADGKWHEVDNKHFDKHKDYGHKSSKSCKFELNSEIIKYEKKDTGQLELEFRTIDSYNPFNRQTNSNWCSESSCDAANSIVEKYISERNNSYNKTSEGALYTNQSDGTKKIILTPELILEIRKYNSTTSYDDYSTYTDENGVITTNFLAEIGITKVNK